MELKFNVTPPHNGKTVLTILRREMNLSASLVRRLKRVQAIFINEQAVYVNHIVQDGDVITADLASAEAECDIVPEYGSIDIVYEDSALLAVNKPAGLLVHPSHARYTGTLANFVSGYFFKKYGDGRCHAVNRLDRDTSGVVLFAKNSHAKNLASQALKSPDAEKNYIALVYGVFAPSEGTIDMPIKRLCEGDMLRVVDGAGQRAVTHYRTLKTVKLFGEDISLISLRLETGRTHQIRVHCLASGHPILGDVLYFSEASKKLSAALGISAQALHAGTLSFMNFSDNKRLNLTAKLNRADMNGIISQL